MGGGSSSGGTTSGGGTSTSGSSMGSGSSGSGSRDSVNASFLQPFISYTTKQATSFTLNTEAGYDWEHRQWTTPINLMVAQVFKISGQPISAQIGGRYIPAGPSALPDWGFRFALTFLFPK